MHAVKNAGPPQKLRVVVQTFRKVLQSRVATPCEFFRIRPGEGAKLQSHDSLTVEAAKMHAHEVMEPNVQQAFLTLSD
eukprot:6455013-Amphidinium_carterae.3